MKTNDAILRTLIVAAMILITFVVIAVTVTHDFSPVEGVVTAKGYSPSSTSTSIMLMPDGNGGTTMYPQTTYEPEHWYVYVGHRHARVTHEAYDQIQIGDYFSESRK